ncbi:M16 family metallopeptidase [Enhygromyxa salina]|uniref:M16 family metallopeptidase n=1 Tax=Enhygromyxa salina TaxID=215803 RepID=UPI0004E6D79E|nr:M16 family metallopeptidase [Enhygromyxa salina]
MFARLLMLTIALLFAPPETVGTVETDAQPSEAELPPAPTPSFEFQTYEGDPIGVKQIVLDNGLTVLLSENHERPEVFGAVVVRTGGKNDPADNTGMAHYLEHMLFKGTKTLGTSNWAAEQQLQAQIVELYERHKRATTDEQRAKLQADIAKTVEQTYAYVIPNELDRMLEETGGSGVNAFTTEDETVYYNTFPTSQIDTWLQIYAHRFTDPVFRLFPTELEAVYEEKNISLDRFEVRLYEAFIRRAFPDHPYGTQSVLGEVEHLEQPSLVAMQAYFDEYYVANNVALVLSGDFDANAIMPVIEAQFGAWRSGPKPEPRGGTVEPFDGRELVKLRLTPVRVGAYGFRTVPTRHPDYAALQVVRELLFNEQGSGFIDNLVDEGKILIALPFMQEFADHGLDIVFFAPRILGQTFKNAEQQILEQYHRVARGEFDEQRMLAIRDGLRRAEDRKWEDNEARALALADSFIRRDSWAGYLDYREQLATLTREDVMRVAGELFGEDYLAMRSRVGFAKKTRLSKPHYPAVDPVAGAHSQFYDEVMSQPNAPAALRFVNFEADVATTQISPGVTLRTNANPFNDTYTLDLRFKVGTDRIRELGVATEYIDRIGTREHSPAAFREALSLLGTTFTIGATLDETVVRLTGPEPQLPAALELLDALLREPVADRKRSKVMRRERSGYERVQRRDPSHVAGALREYVMYGEQSYYLRDYGRNGLRKLSGEELIAAWQRAQGYALEIRYTGQRALAELQELLGAGLQLDGSRESAVEHVVRPRVMPDRDTVFFLPRRNAIQTQLVFLVDGDAVPREQLAAADAYSEYMGGSMAGVVFQEIREFRALAYSASGRFARDDNPAQAGYFVGGIGCQADKTAEAIAVMMGLIRELPVKPERMDAIRSSLGRGLETRSPGFRELHSTLAGWRRLGYADDPGKWLIEEYAQLNFADIEAFHAAQVADRPVMLLVVGDPRRVDVRELERYGEVVKVRENQLFAR